MVVYAVAADASVIRMFLAGFLPGLLVMALFCGYIAWWACATPTAFRRPSRHRASWHKLRRTGNLIPCALLIVFIVWVLVAGWATATESAAFGVLGALVIAAAGRSLTWQNFWQGLVGATRLSCMIMFILAGAAFLTKTMAFTGIPRELAEWVAAAQLSPYALIAVLVVVYLVLGTALDGISMIVLTSAVVLPMVKKAGFDLIWFGIFIIILIEIAEITPPVGFNLFVLQNMTGMRQQPHRARDAAVLRLPAGGDRADHGVPVNRHSAARRRDGTLTRHDPTPQPRGMRRAARRAVH